jgi:hypothetical protein
MLGKYTRCCILLLVLLRATQISENCPGDWVHDSKIKKDERSFASGASDNFGYFPHGRL